MWSSSRISFRAHAFTIYKNDLPPTVNTLLEPIIFADYRSVINSSKIVDYFCTLSNIVLSHVIKWFAVKTGFS
jgi:hypothetical protein